jgi:hypothetical protein
MSIQHCEDCGDELTIQLWKKAENLAVSFSTTLYCHSVLHCTVLT